MPDGITDNRLRAGVLRLFHLGVVWRTAIALSSKCLGAPKGAARIALGLAPSIVSIRQDLVV